MTRDSNDHPNFSTNNNKLQPDDDLNGTSPTEVDKTSFAVRLAAAMAAFGYALPMHDHHPKPIWGWLSAINDM